MRGSSRRAGPDRKSQSLPRLARCICGAPATEWQRPHARCGLQKKRGPL